MQTLEIDTDKMQSETNKLSDYIKDSLNGGTHYDDFKVSSCSAVSWVGNINNYISNVVTNVNNSIDKANSSANEFIEKSNAYLNAIIEADGIGLMSAMGYLPESLAGIKVDGDSWNYDNNDKNKKDKKFFGDYYLGSMPLGKGKSIGPDGKPIKTSKGKDRNFGATQGVTTATYGGKEYMVVTSYTKDAEGNSTGYIRIIDPQTGRVVKWYKLKGSHAGGVAYQNGKLIVADSGLTYFDFNNLMNNSAPDTGAYLPNTGSNHIKGVKVDGGNNNNGSVAGLTIDEQGRIVTFQFHSNTNDYKKNGGPSSDLQFYTLDDNGFHFQGDSTVTAESTQGRTNSGGNTNGFTELQGMSNLSAFGVNQTIFTSSYFANHSNDNHTNSKIIIASHGTDSNYNYTDKDNNDIVKEISLPPGAEQVTRMADGNYAIIFEGENPRVVFVSADYFLRYADNGQSYTDWKNWKNTNPESDTVFDKESGEIYYGVMSKPLQELVDIKDRLSTQKTLLAETCQVDDILQCSVSSEIKANYDTLTNQIKVLSEAIEDLRSKIWTVGNNYKKTDES